MTISELNPEDNNRLRELAEYRNSLGCAPIDQEANEFVDYLVSRTGEDGMDDKLIEKSVDFMSRLVGWSSKNLDEETGQVRIAQLDMTDSHDAELDRLGVKFLSESNNVVSNKVVNDGVLTSEYFFHQLRKSGKVRAITVFRKETIGKVEPNSVTYCLTYEEVGKHGPDVEKLLSVGKIWLESTPPVKIAYAAMEKTVGARNRAFRFGHHTLTALMPSETNTTEDS